MKRPALVLVALVSLVAAAPAHARLTSASRVTTAGVGPIRIGMTIREARRAAGRRILLSADVSPGCQVADLLPRAYGVSLLLTRGRVARVYVDRRGIATGSGVRIGDSIQRLKRVYGRRLVSVPDAYTRAERVYELRFGSRKVTFLSSRGRVAVISTGRRPEIDYIEGCA